MRAKEARSRDNDLTHLQRRPLGSSLAGDEHAESAGTPEKEFLLGDPLDYRRAAFVGKQLLDLNSAAGAGRTPTAYVFV